MDERSDFIESFNVTIFGLQRALNYYLWLAKNEFL